MLDKIKNYSIIFLLVAVIGAFFYGKNLGESETPPPPALSVKSENEGEKAAADAQSIKAVSLKKTTSFSGNKKTGEFAKNITEDFSFQSEDSMTVSTAKYREMEELIKNSIQPTWGLALGTGRQRDLSYEFYSLGYAHSIGKNLYFIGDIGFSKINNIYEVENGRASVIKLFGGSN